MSKVDLQLDSTDLATVSLDPQDIYANGGPDFPILYIRTDFGITPYQEYGQTVIKPLTCLAFFAELCSPRERTVARFQHSDCQYSSRKDARTYVSRVTFAVPLDLRTVDHIEQSRNGNLQAALKIKVLIAVHSADDKVIETLRYASLSEMRFTIPKSEWVGRITSRAFRVRINFFCRLIRTRPIRGAIKSSGNLQMVNRAA